MSESQSIYKLEVSLRSVKPRVWRRIEVRSKISLAEFSGNLEAAMGWFGGHLHAFAVDGVRYEQPDPYEGLFRDDRDESEHQLGSVMTDVGAKMQWDYDFGDGWSHTVKLESIDQPTQGVTYPRCIAGRQACPPEDCGGPHGYEELLEAIADPRHPRHEELVDWLPPGYDPAHFNPIEATEDMQAPRPLDGFGFQ